MIGMSTSSNPRRTTSSLTWLRDSASTDLTASSMRNSRKKLPSGARINLSASLVLASSFVKSTPPKVKEFMATSGAVKSPAPAVIRSPPLPVGRGKPGGNGNGKPTLLVLVDLEVEGTVAMPSTSILRSKDPRADLELSENVSKASNRSISLSASNVDDFPYTIYRRASRSLGESSVINLFEMYGKASSTIAKSGSPTSAMPSSTPIARMISAKYGGILKG
mmetsp:Transcript_15195/g.43221  ORF Transcript_15195/g.43221 Transcript_15195/m.43221 type:complete len:221 (+) Transcript_15195:352-1014(+)